jgi:DNA-binding GntR family transcriptional regulator
MSAPSDELDRNAGGTTRLAYDSLRAAILDGALVPGQVLSQVQLAKEFGVSRTPLREAIRLLQREGLLESEPNRRVRVSSISVVDLEQLFASRIVLESFGVRVAVPRHTPETIATLRRAFADLSAALERRDHDAFRPAHESFRLNLFTGCGDRLEADLQRLYANGERYRQLFLGAADHELALYGMARHDYSEMLAAAEARDGDACSQLTARHLARSALTVIARQQPEYDPVLIRQAMPFGLQGRS